MIKYELTGKELEIFDALAQGLTQKTIMERYNITRHRLEKCINNVIKLTSSRNKIEAVCKLIKEKIIF